MSISTKQLRAQLEAACVLMEGDTITLEKIEKIKVLLTGINPGLDTKLDAVFKAYGHLKSSLSGDIIHLSIHGLPETTLEDKKRKKVLIFFITSWKSLKSEVARVQGYYHNSQSGTSKASSVVKTGLFAKGPFGLITGVAIVVVGVGLLLKQATTSVEIINLGCPPLTVPGELPFKIPGLRLPESPIISGSPSTTTLPALSIIVRASSSSISATILGQTGSYSLPSRTKDVIFDGRSLLNQTTTLKLGSSRTHNLTIKCK